MYLFRRWLKKEVPRYLHIPRSPFVPSSAQPSDSHVESSIHAELGQLGLKALRTTVVMEPYSLVYFIGGPEHHEPPSL